MSHTTMIKSVPIKSVTALRSAVRCLNKSGVKCELVQDADARMYYASQGKGMDYVLKLEGCKYDVGFKKETDGTLTPAIDTWGGHVSRVLGTDAKEGPQGHIGQLLREYSKEVTMEAAAEQGQMIESCELDAEGKYQITIAV